MSSIFERLVGGLFGILNFFESLRAERSDNEFVAEYKRLQRACIASVVCLLVMLVAITAAAHFVDALEGLTTIHLTLTGTRETLPCLFGGVFLLAMLYAGYNWISLLRFVRKHGAP